MIINIFTRNNFEFFLFFISSLYITFFYIPYGFNPTDDGLFLAAAKRIQLGQIPHIDFISVRPAGSAFLHSIFTRFFTDNLFLATRFFNGFQFAFICFIWFIIIDKNVIRLKLAFLARFFLLLTAFMLSLHDAPFMSWATIDGLFFSSIGFYFILTKNSSKKYIGYLLFGIAILCKQSFIFPPFIMLAVLKDWRDFKNLIFLILPGFTYVLIIFFLGGINDLIFQMSNPKNLIMIFGRTSQYFFDREFLIGFLLIIFFDNISLYTGSNVKKSLIQNRIIILIQFLFISFFIFNFFRFLLSSDFKGFSMFLFGCNFGLMMPFFFKEKFNPILNLYISVLLLAWATSLSRGFGMPTYASGSLFLTFFITIILYKDHHITKSYFFSINKLIGPMVGIAFLIFFIFFSSKDFLILLQNYKYIGIIDDYTLFAFIVIFLFLGLLLIINNSSYIVSFLSFKNKIRIIVFSIMILVFFPFNNMRNNHITRELNKDELVYSLTGIFPGAKGIFTNINTYNVIKELDIIIEKYNDYNFTIVPDFAAYWGASNYINPLSADWHQRIEVPYGSSYDRVKKDIFNLINNDSGVVVLQKFEAHGIHKQRDNIISDDYQPLVLHIKQNYDIIDETENYLIYGKLIK